MALKRFAKVKDAIKAAFDSKDEKELNKALDATEQAMKDEAEEAEKEAESRTKWNDEALDNRFDEIKTRQDAHDAKMKTHDSEIETLKAKTGESEEEQAENEKAEDAMKDEAPEDFVGDTRKVKDSAFLSESYQQTIALAEVMAPGLHFQTFDAKADKRKTFDSMCAHRRKALGVAAATTDGAAIVREIHGRVLTADGIKTMDCAAVRTLFLAAGSALKARSRDTSKTGIPVQDAAKKPLTIADINKRNREHYSQK